MSSITPNDAFIKQVMTELNITHDDLQMFTHPKQFFRKYVRNIFYNITKHQFGLFLNVVEFPNNVRTVKDMQKSSIMFLEQNPYYQDVHYFLIWEKFAHQYFLHNYQKIQITDIQFENSHVNQIELSFSNNQSQSNDNAQQTNENYAMTYNNNNTIEVKTWKT